VVRVEVVSTDELGDRSYVVHDGEVALVVDPQRDIDRVEKLLSDLDLRCGLVAETHIHNDYVSGGLELARRSGAPYLVSAADDVAFGRQPVADGDELRAGRLHVMVVATPGHTDGHVSYVVDDGDGPEVVFTGGSLLFGSVGRTDLVDPQRTVELTRAQYRSTRHLALLLADDVAIYPTHGFGSFCSSGSTTGDTDSTVGAERSRNDALVIDDEDEFVAKLVAGLTAFPSYYVHMGPRNRQGAGPVDFSTPEPTDAHELRRRISGGQWVVDLRSRTAFAAEHLGGTIGIGLGQDFATYLGWLIPWGTPLTLIGESAEQISSAQRQLVRIGIDRPDGAAVGRPADLTVDGGLRHYPTATFKDLAGEHDGVVLDVRRDDERRQGHIPGSVHIPLQSLLERTVDLPAGRLWVHCASGYRASIAASLLDRAGRDVVLIDDDFENAKDLLADGPE
jgi:glyoxylase-like metal-dependent hydrolase (beta-lactamase superfamily II)/rhodanese-related sulfurtransferase